MLKIKARVSAQRVEECLSIALETQRRDHGVHVRTDARDLGEPDRMHRLRRQRRRRLHPHAVGVPLLAERQVREGDAGAGLGQVLGLDEVVQALVGGIQASRDRTCVGLPEPRLLGGGDRLGKARDRPVEHALRGIGGDEVGELRQRALHEHLRLHDALGCAPAHVGDRLVDPHDEAVDALQPVLIVADGLERLRARA